jgi:hypothetical protein
MSWFERKSFLRFTVWDYTFALLCDQAVPPPAGAEDQRSDKGVDQRRKTTGALVIAFIDDRLEKLKSFERRALEREKLALEAERPKVQLAVCGSNRQTSPLRVPPGPAMSQLDRRQRRRRGENVPTRQHQFGEEELDFFTKQSQEAL